VEWEGGTGVTRDFNALGVYFETNPPPVGGSVEFCMELDQAGLSEPHRVRFQGEIVRVEPNSSKTGIAVAIHSHFFEGLRAPEEK
jgi:hypothetical protein